MKFKKMIDIMAESYEEEQFLLVKFPEVWWDDRSGVTHFYVEEMRINEVLEVLSEWNTQTNA
jgi:hypothetical protein